MSIHDTTQTVATRWRLELVAAIALVVAGKGVKCSAAKDTIGTPGPVPPG